MNLKQRARRITDYLDELDHDDKFPEKTYNAVLKELQHVRRGTLEEVRVILDEARRDTLGDVSSHMTLWLNRYYNRIRAL